MRTAMETIWSLAVMLLLKLLKFSLLEQPHLLHRAPPLAWRLPSISTTLSKAYRGMTFKNTSGGSIYSILNVRSACPRKQNGRRQFGRDQRRRTFLERTPAARMEHF